MTAVFSEKEKKEAFAIKRRLWTYWFIALGIYVAALATMITINAVSVVVYRDRSVYIPFLVASCALGIAFGCGSLFFFSVKFKLTSRYCRMLRNMRDGIKERGHGKFTEIRPDITEKEGVYFYTLVLDCPPLKRGDITERHILVERTHSLPQMQPGDEVKFVTHANILMAYEITPAENPVAAADAEEAAADEIAPVTEVTAESAAADEE